MAWRIAQSLLTLLAEVNALYPSRAKGTDGGISGYTYGPGGVVVNPYNYSGHNINSRGVICAFDITTGDRPGGISSKDGQALAERIRIAMRDQSRGQTPYVIHWMAPPYVAIAGTKIASAYDNWAWHTYYGADDHKSHIHPSVDWDIPHGGAPSDADYDTTASWNLGSTSGQSATITPITEEGFLMALSDADQIEVRDNLRKLVGMTADVQGKVADIGTAAGTKSLRQFVADGTRAAQTAAAQTADIRRGGHDISLRQEVADIKTSVTKSEPVIVAIAEAVVTAPDVDGEA